MSIFDFFKPKPPQIPTEFNKDEAEFYRELLVQFKNAGIKQNINYRILSDKTINFGIEGGGQIGRVKIRGRKTRMQFLTMNSVKWIEDISVSQMISYIPKWISWAKSLLR